MNQVFFSKKTDDWATPKWMYNYFINELKAYDPCPFQSKQDLLFEDSKSDIMFINPPYSNIIDFVNYGIRQLDIGKVKHIIYLIPVRSETKYFQKIFKSGYLKTIYLIKGRVHFNESKSGAPFPSCLIHLSSDLTTNDIFNNHFSRTKCYLIDQNINELKVHFNILKGGEEYV